MPVMQMKGVAFIRLQAKKKPDLMSPTKRLFIGTMLSSQAAGNLAELRKAIEPDLEKCWQARLRFVKPEKLHMTWLFLGNCTEVNESEIVEKLSSIQNDCKRMKIQFESLGFFPDKRRPVGMALLPERVPEQVFELSGKLRSAFSHLENADTRDLKPHITIFRFPKESRRKYQIESLPDLSSFLPFELDIGCLSLVESHFGDGALEYKVLRNFELS